MDTTDEEYVDILYTVFLNRTADAAGRAYWIDYLESGASRDYVLRGFVYSVEFDGICDTYNVDHGQYDLTAK